MQTVAPLESYPPSHVIHRAYSAGRPIQQPRGHEVVPRAQAPEKGQLGQKPQAPSMPPAVSHGDCALLMERGKDRIPVGLPSWSHRGQSRKGLQGTSAVPLIL